MDEISARTFLNPWMMCATCKRVLEKKTLFTGGVSWQHPSDMINTEDHPAAPVPLDETASEKCDVCFADNPAWVLPANDFQTDPRLPISTSDWALCDVCAAIIRSDRWELLYERGVENYEARHGAMLPEVRAILRKMYAMLRENVTGEIHRKGNS